MRFKSKMVFYTIIQIFLILYFFSKKYHKKNATIHVKSVNDSRFYMETIFKRRILFVSGTNNSGLEIITPFLKSIDQIKVVDFGSDKAIDFYNYAKNVNKKKMFFIKNARVKSQNINKAIGLFTYYILASNVSLNDFICSIEKRNALLMEFYNEIFPNSKFIYLVRDGREIAYSEAKGKPTFQVFLKNLNKWNKFNMVAFNNCQNVGLENCFLIRYDQLVQNPSYYFKMIAKFLRIDNFQEKNISYQPDSNVYSFKKIAKYNSSKVEEKFSMLTTLNFI